ncbi:MAG: hypothetical protein ACI86S_000569 [Paracoccaceae bacterium]|jgi:hypothetical protein
MNAPILAAGIRTHIVGLNEWAALNEWVVGSVPERDGRQGVAC